VLVPPWNRLDAGLIERLTGCGFVGLSTMGRVPQRSPRPVWCRSTRTSIRSTARQPAARRRAAALAPVAVLDGDEPIGIPSHHLTMDEAGWLFLDRCSACSLPTRRPPAPGRRAVRAMTGPLLEIRDLAVDFLADEGVVQAVRGVSFTVEKAQTVALVGESGSGKTVISQAILGILPQIARITRGSIILRDPRRNHEPLDLAAYADDDPVRRSIRGGRISIIFQEPMSSLSPLHTIGDQICEALLLHSDVDHGEGQRRTIQMLGRVGFPDPERAFTYPFELWAACASAP
jgi:ABC-type lipoprotein export system ATPase subunit